MKAVLCLAALCALAGMFFLSVFFTLFVATLSASVLFCLFVCFDVCLSFRIYFPLANITFSVICFVFIVLSQLSPFIHSFIHSFFLFALLQVVFLFFLILLSFANHLFFFCFHLSFFLTCAALYTPVGSFFHSLESLSSWLCFNEFLSKIVVLRFLI